MDGQSEPGDLDYDKLRREIAEAVRRTLRELAAERGMGYDDYLDWFFGEDNSK